MALFRRKAAKGLTEAQLEARIGPALVAFRGRLRDGETIDEESITLLHPRALDPSTGQWIEGPLNFVAVTSQVLVAADPVTGERNIEYDILGLHWFKIKPEDETMMIQFTGVNKDLIQTIVFRLAGPTDWPSMMRGMTFSGLAHALTGAWEKATGKEWDYLAMQQVE